MNRPKLVRYSDLKIGQRASISKTITDADIANFVSISGDINPLHVSEAFARQTFFKRRIAHGMLSAALFSTIVGMLLPGTGAIYRSQSLEFLQPVHIGDELTASMEVVDINKEEEFIVLKGEIVNQDGGIVIQGDATVGLIRDYV